MKMLVPCNVCIKRFYRAYVEVDADATDEEIQEEMRSSILTHQDSELCDDPDMEIEPEDIVSVYPDIEGAWTEGEDAEYPDVISYHRKEEEV